MSSAPPDCLFCKIVAREIPAQLIHEDSEAVAFKDIDPKAPTHVLVIPRKHVPSLAESTDEDAALLGRLQRVAVGLAKKGGLESFRLVVNNGKGAGQTVWHLHYHLLGGRPLEWPPG
jgi:histidine triad (HIT) family protein